MRRRRLIVTVAASSLVALSGCGASDEGFAPAAEPAVSPALDERPPAGRTFEVGSEPEGLAVDGRSGIAAAITRDPSTLALIDLDRERVARRVTLPATGRHLTIAAPGGPVLAPIEQTDELVEVDLRSGRRRTIEVGDHPHDATASAGRIFVGNEFANTVSVVDGGRQTSTLTTPEQPGGVVASAGCLAVVAVAERVLAVYDARSLERLATLPAGEGPTHVVAAGDRAWVADTAGGALLEYRLGRRPELLSSTPAPGAPYGIAVDPRRELVWVTLTARNQLVSYDVSGERPRELGRYPVLRQPNSVAVDPRDGAAVVAGRVAGRLELIPAEATG